MNYYVECLINIFRTNKDIPNPRPKPLPYLEMNKLEWKPDRLIIHNPTFVVSKAIVDMLNRLKISEAFEKQEHEQ